MVRAVLFDFYGVFLPDAYSAWLEKNGLRREGIYAELIRQLDRALISEADFLEQLSNATGFSVKSGDIHQAHQPSPALIEYTTTLRPTYTVGLFSNASTKLRKKLDDLGMAPLFDHIIVSSEIGYAKPSDQAFEAALHILGVSAQETIFIDDNLSNIEAAARLGLQTIHHIDTEATISSLRDAGVQ